MRLWGDKQTVFFRQVASKYTLSLFLGTAIHYSRSPVSQHLTINEETGTDWLLCCAVGACVHCARARPAVHILTELSLILYRNTAALVALDMLAFRCFKTAGKAHHLQHRVFIVIRLRSIDRFFTEFLLMFTVIHGLRSIAFCIGALPVAIRSFLFTFSFRSRSRSLSRSRSRSVSLSRSLSLSL